MHPTGAGYATLAALDAAPPLPATVRGGPRWLPGLEPVATRGRVTGRHADPSGRIDSLTRDGRRARTRLPAGTPPALRRQLTRFAQVGALAHAAVGLYAYPARAGAVSLEGEVFRARLERWDATVLHEFLTAAGNLIDDIRVDVERTIEAVEPSEFAPGTRDKVSVMAARWERGKALFSERDAA